MAEIWIASDHHADHENILKFQLDDGTPMRPFKDAKEMLETLVSNHNAIVKPQDKVYFLGDFVMKARNISLAALFNGHKRLIRGNHDDGKSYVVQGIVGPVRTSDYLKYFEEIYASRLLDNLLLTHYPVHPDSIKVEWTNVHGHTHNNQPQGALGTKYYNVCVEMTDYRPLALYEVKERIAALKRQNQALVMQHLASMGVDLNQLDVDELNKL